MEEQKKQYHDWLKIQDGKWFYINFNDVSKVIIKFNYDSVCSRALYVYNDGNKSQVRKENRFMNPLWIVPLYPPNHKLFADNKSDQYTPVKEVKEISEQYAEKMFRLYDSSVKCDFIDIFGEHKNKWYRFTKYINKFLRLK